MPPSPLSSRPEGPAPAVAEQPAPSRAHLRLLPSFQLEIGCETVAVCGRCERLLALLAVRAAAMRRDTVATTLWPEATPERARANLRTTLWTVKRSGAPVVQVSPTHVRLAPEVHVDVLEAGVRARQLIDSTVDPGFLPEAWDLLNRDLLEDWEDEWVRVDKEHFRQLRLQALERLGEAFLGHGAVDRAVVVGLGILAHEPLRERAHWLVTAGHLVEGNRHEAITQYRRYEKLMRDHLGLHPSTDMASLLSQALAEDFRRVGVPRPAART